MKCKTNIEPVYSTEIYPNPFEEAFTIECSYYVYPKALKLELHGDFQGQKVLVFRDTLKYENQKFQIIVPSSAPQQILAIVDIGGFSKTYTLQQK